MKNRIHVFLSLIILLWLNGCCAKSTVVLIPDFDGHVGQVTVATEGGQKVLNEANQAVEVMNKKEAPGKVERLSSEEIRSTFSEALAARPVPPVKFTLYFLPGSNDLTEESKAVLPEIIRVMQSRHSDDIVISGHTDTVGEKDFNYRLALERSQTASQIMVAKGADPSIIKVTSHGEGNPLIRTADEVAEPRNRRVEVTIR